MAQVKMSKHAQLTIEFLSNFLLTLLLISLFAGGLLLIKKHAIEQTKEQLLLTKLQEIQQELDVYLTSNYLTWKERIQKIRASCSEDLCYKLVNNTIILEYNDSNYNKTLVGRTLSYKDVDNEAV